MEAAKAFTRGLPSCCIKDCIGLGLWKVGFRVEGGLLETTVNVCDAHRDSSLPFAAWIFSQPGMLDDLQRQLDRNGIATKLSADMIPVFALAVIPIITPPAKS